MSQTPLTSEEYEARRIFLSVLKTVTQNEYIGLASILHKHGIPMSANQTGLLVDLTQVPNAIFEELLKFHTFVEHNNIELSIRDAEIAELKTENVNIANISGKQDGLK